MITQGETIPEYGEYVEKKFILIDNVIMKYNDYAVIYVDQEEHERIRLYMNQGQLCYDFNTGLGWQQGGSLTPTTSNRDRFPQTGNSYIQINENVFKIVQRGVQQLQLDYTSDIITLNNKHITGVVPSSDPSSAVNLAQLQSVVQGETADVIVSIDLATRLKCETDHLQVRLNTYEAFGLYKPDQATTVIALSPGSSGLNLLSQTLSNHDFKILGGNSTSLILRPGSDIDPQLKIGYYQGHLTITEQNNELLKITQDQTLLYSKAQYSFDTLTDQLGQDDLIDMKTADTRYIKTTAQDDLDMNRNAITNVASAVQSTDAVNLGQLPQNHYMYMFLSGDTPVNNEQYIDMQFDQHIDPDPLQPAVTPKIQIVSVGGQQKVRLSLGVYRITQHLVMTYAHSTQSPVIMELVGSVAGSIIQSVMQTQNVDSYTRSVHNERTFLMRVTTLQDFVLRVHTFESFASAIKAGSSLHIELIQ